MASNSLGIDPKKFTHVKSDDKSTVLKHKDGHVLTIAHSVLSPKMRDQLKALSKMGQQDQTDSQAQEAQDQQPRKMADGGAPRWDSYSGTAPVDPRIGGIGRDMKDRTTSAQDKTRHDQNDKNDEAYRKEHSAPAETDDTSGYKDYTPKAKGGVIKMADGGVPTALQPNDDSNTLPQEPSPQPEVKKEEVDPEIQEKRKIYNNLVQTSKGQMGPLSEQQAQFMGYAFGPEGQPPSDFDPKDWQKTEEVYAQQKQQNADQIAQAQQAAIQQNSARTAAGLPPIPVPNVPEGPQVPGSAANPPPETPPVQALNPSGQVPNPMDASMGDTQGMLQSGYSEKLKGIENEAKAKGDLGEQQALSLQKAQQAQTVAKAAYQEHYNQLESERQAHIQDIQDGHIDPNKYWTGDSEGNGSHSKIAAGIGMILAGFNPTNAPNAAINFLKYQMDKNIESQRANLDSKNNLLRANLEQFHNLKDATDMTRIMQNDVMQNELAQASAKATNPMAKAAALQAQGALKMEAAPMFQQFAMRRAMMGMANNGSDPSAVDHMLGYMRVVNPEMAKEMESRYIPVVGLASTPLSSDVRNQITSKQTLDGAAKDLMSYSQKHTNIVPGTPEYTFGVTKAMAFQQMVREGLLGTVFRESEKPLLEKFVKENPAGAFKAFKTQPQLKAIIESNALGLNTLKRSYGLPAQQQSSGPQYKTVNGVKFMRGPNGQAVPVK